MEVSGTVGSLLGQKSPELWFVTPTQTVFETIELMAEKSIGALPVVAEGKLVGMISERDYTRKVILKGRASRTTLVREIMTEDPIVAEPDDSVVDCLNIMTDRRIRHLPVIRGGELIGIVSIGDLVKWIISAQASVIAQLKEYMHGG